MGIQVLFPRRTGRGNGREDSVNAAIIEGKYGQAIPSYGQERKGAPVYTYARIAEGPIDVKSYVYRPNCVICFDTSLADLGIDITEGVRPGSTLIVNTDDAAYENPAFEKVCVIDADQDNPRAARRGAAPTSPCSARWPRPRAAWA